MSNKSLHFLPGAVSARAERGNHKLRIFDRWLGPLILVFLKIFIQPFRKLWSKISTADSNQHRVAVIKFAGIGDVILLSGVLTDLRRHFGRETKITLFVGKENYSYAQFLSDIDEVIAVDVTSPRLACRKMREKCFDLVFNFDSWSRWSAILTALMRANTRIGFRTPGQYRHFCDEVSVFHRADLHETQNDQNCLRALGISVDSPLQKIGPRWSMNHLATHPFLILHLWASGVGGRLKEWPAEKWTELIQKIPRRILIVLTGSKNDLARGNQFLSMLPDEEKTRVSLQMHLDFRELVQLMTHSLGVVSVDTGVAHCAAAHDVPTLVLFGPSSPARWGPVGTQTLSVFRPKPEATFFSLGFEISPNLNSIQTISVDDVTDGLQKLGVLTDL